MKKSLFLILLMIFTLSSRAQIKWYDPMKLGYPVIQNQGFINSPSHSEISSTYCRLPADAEQKVRKDVWNLSRNSAGLAIYFYSNAPKVIVRYVTTSKNYSMPHMPSIGISGVDLYSRDTDGRWNTCKGPYSFGDTVTFTFATNKPAKYHKHGFEYRLYLPLYNTVKWMEIGVPEDSEMKFMPQSTEKPILLYGTSIAQGACASRPGMAWSNIIQRDLDYPLINLGFSGNGRLEKEVLDYINQNDCRLYILDCIPNLTDAGNRPHVKQLVKDAVKQIRSKHDAPILLVEYAGFSNGRTDTANYIAYTEANKFSKEAYNELMNENIKDLYYLTNEEMNLSDDALVDWTHPSDFGMVQQSAAVEKKIRDILHIPTGSISTTIPVTQRREPDMYEWRDRHIDFLKAVEKQPKALIIGNSITHYWSGEPEHRQKNGKETWEKFMRPAGFQNLGCGWDRIENVLWRVYHGELDGYKANQIVLMIGTNNNGLNSDQEIVDGLQFLIRAIKQRQPQATLKVVGILPRRNGEEWVKNINRSIKTMAELENCTFINSGDGLLLPDGKLNEAMFIGDGLHPNDKGYSTIAPLLVK